MVGRSLLQHLAGLEFKVYAALRRLVSELPAGVEAVQVGDIGPYTDWKTALSGIDVVIHTAARVHVMHDVCASSLDEFRKVNVHGTLKLAQQAAKLGVKRFVFISSIKVNGEETVLGQAFTERDEPAPVDPYSISKYEAEQGLLKMAEETGMEIVIIRAPLVYGPGVKANLFNLMRWLKMGIPLPLRKVHNKRTLLALGNLVDLIVTCIKHPAATNQIFLAGDGEDMSTTELLTRMGMHLGKPARLIPVPQKIIQICFKFIGRKDLAQRLCGSLQVNISKARELLGWTPPVSVDEALQKTARYFLESQI